MTGRRADRGWLILAAYVLGHNAIAAARGNEMLSQAVDRYLVVRPVATTAAVALVSLHLLNRLPSWGDPIGGLMGSIARKIGPLA